MKTKLEIIEEIASTYNANNRSVDRSGICQYYIDGKMCAVGRCMVYPERYKNIVCSVDYLDLEGVLKPEYHGHSINFWIDMQYFHDDVEYWNDDGLSPEGIEFKKKLIEVYQ